MNIFEIAIENFDKINKVFNINFEETNKHWRGKCPLHGGDNPGSVVIYKSGHSTTGSWKCYTSNCHNIYGHHILGFIKGLLTQKYKREFNNFEVTAWCEKLFNITADEITERTLDDNLTNFISKTSIVPTFSFKITEQQFVDKLQRPVKYFLDSPRNYKPETLDYFKVGLCTDPTKPMYKRAVFPLYDTDGKFVIACLGRIIFEKCNVCSHYHNPHGICRESPKWKNSLSFPSETSLLNFSKAKSHIKSTGIVLLTEGAPNIMRLHEAGFPMAVGCLGSKFSEFQRNLLDSTGCHTIISVRDAGSAGEIMVNQVKEQCRYTHNLVTIEPSYDDDIGACNVETVKKIIGPYIDKVTG